MVFKQQKRKGIIERFKEARQKKKELEAFRESQGAKFLNVVRNVQKTIDKIDRPDLKRNLQFRLNESGGDIPFAESKSGIGIAVVKGIAQAKAVQAKARAEIVLEKTIGRGV